MTREQIKEKYWIDFLIWYTSSDNKLIDYSVDGNSFHNTYVVMPVNDLFWYWFCKVHATNESARQFFNDLRKVPEAQS